MKKTLVIATICSMFVVLAACVLAPKNNYASQHPYPQSAMGWMVEMR